MPDEIQNFPHLRNLQCAPIKQQDDQYIVLWDPAGLSPEKLILPLNYFYLVQFFDGEHSLEQIGGEYLKKFGEFLVPERLSNLVREMEGKLFLEGKAVEEAKRKAQEAYRQGPLRLPCFAGKSYEGESESLRLQLEGFFNSKEGPGTNPSEHRGKKIRGMVVPHHEIREAGPIYAWAYKELQEVESPSVFVILGTCHAGLEHGFAVTDKDFAIPLGNIAVHRPIVDRLKTEGAYFFEEDRQHQHEHSVEFQLPFLQYALGKTKPFTIVPILCSFPPGCLTEPELQPLSNDVETFVTLLQKVIGESGEEVCVIASADLAHIGLRYGDQTPPTDFSFHRCLQTDLEMLKHVENLDGKAFADFLVKEDDRRRVCGFSPIYTMLRIMKAEKGQVLRYDRAITDQFNSTVTYASMVFF